MKQYTYKDREGKVAAVVFANSITEADEMTGMKQATVCIGGKLIFINPSSARTAVLQRNKAGFPTDVMTIPAKPLKELKADSLKLALEIHSREVQKVRYNPEVLILWKTAAGTEIVKEF